MFSKKEYLKNVNSLSLFQSISYNNVNVNDKIYFLPTFLKSWVHLGIGTRILLRSIIIEMMFLPTFKELLVWKKLN